MGFGKWLQRIGATGGIARWGYKHYMNAKASVPEATESEICQMLYSDRFRTFPLKKEIQKAHYKEFHNAGTFKNLERTLSAIATIEFELYGFHNLSLDRKTTEVICEELERLGYKKEATTKGGL